MSNAFNSAFRLPTSAFHIPFRLPPSAFLLRSALPLLLAVSLQLVAVAQAKAATTSSPSSIDGLDCITSYEPADEPTQVCEDSNDPWNDMGESASVADDNALIPSGNSSIFSSFFLPTSSLFPSPPDAYRITPILQHTGRSFYCQHNHIRERAPPSLT